MRLFTVSGDGKFDEYKEQNFKKRHPEKDLESWLEDNPDAILDGERLLIIGRQVRTSLGKLVDLLAVDRTGNTVVLEFKRDKTPRETLAQALEYAAFCETLDYEQLEQVLRSSTGEEAATLSEEHRAFFSLAEDEAASFNKEQRIIIVAQEITPEIRETAMFLRQKRLAVTCVEFRYFQSASREEVLATETVLGKEPTRDTTIVTGSLPRTDETKFLGSVDKPLRAVFKAILALADSPDLIHWGQSGFSLNVDIDGKHVNLCWGLPRSSPRGPVPGGQSVRTTFREIERNVSDASELIASFKERFRETGLFVPAGNEMRWRLQEPIADEQIGEVTNLLLDLAQHVRERGLAE